MTRAYNKIADSVLLKLAGKYHSYQPKMSVRHRATMNAVLRGEKVAPPTFLEKIRVKRFEQAHSKATDPGTFRRWARETVDARARRLGKLHAQQAQHMHAFDVAEDLSDNPHLRPKQPKTSPRHTPPVPKPNATVATSSVSSSGIATKAIRGWSRRSKILAGTAAGLAAVGGGYAAYKHLKKPKYDWQKAASIADYVLLKTAALEDADIAAGIAGIKNRNIAQDEIDDYLAEAAEQATQKTKHWGRTGALLGGGLGAVGMGLLGGLSRGGGLQRGLLSGVGGAVGGGLLGGGLGLLSASGERNRAQRSAEFLGSVAQGGRLPREEPYPGAFFDAVPFAVGEQDGARQYHTPEEYDALKRELRNAALMRGGLHGAARGALYGALDSDSDISDVAGSAALFGGTGALSEAIGTSRRANQLDDLYARGYGHLADRLKAQYTRGAFDF